MTSKKPAAAKRSTLPRACDHTKAFVKDWTRLSHSGRYDLKQLKEAMLLLIANDAPLGAEWLDHPLTGDWVDHRECHIGGDFLLIYRVESRGQHEQIVFVRAGTHAELFGRGKTETDPLRGIRMKPNRSRFSRFREILMLQSGRPPTPLPATTCRSEFSSIGDAEPEDGPVTGHSVDGRRGKTSAPAQIH